MGLIQIKPSIIQIPLTEVEFHPLSFGDPNGRLFVWKGQLYRGINQGRASFYKQLFQDDVVRSLVEKGLLVHTELTDLALDEYELVLRHHYVPFVSYPYEWCGTMLKDAALLIVDLEIELAKHGLTLQDAHPWNVLFDGCRPVYVDFGSIVPARGDRVWHAHDEFCRFFVHPLQLMAHGYGRIARWLLHDYDQGVLRSDVAALVRGASSGVENGQTIRNLVTFAKQRVSPRLRSILKKGYTLLQSNLSKPASRIHQSRHDLIQGVRQGVEDIALPFKRTEWSDYYEGSYPPFAPSDEWTEKHRSVHRVLSDLRPSSVLDIGSNRGWYAQLAAVLGSRVVALDVDESCVTQFYSDAKGRNLPILPLVMDFRNPSPGYGLSNQWLAPATQRLRCDFLLALALLHHLVFKQHLNFEQIIEGLSVFSKRWLLVEFIPREDQYVREWWSEEYSWYTLENFIAALRRQFHSVEVYPSYPEPRVLVQCEK